MKLGAWCLEAGGPSVDVTKEQEYEWLKSACEHRMDLCRICITLDWGILVQNRISANTSV